MIPGLLGLGTAASVLLWAVLALVVLYGGRYVYELASSDDGARESFRDTSEWFGALIGAAVGAVALLVVEGVEVIGMFVDFVGGHALGFVATVLTALSAALAEGVVSLSGQAVVGIAVALVGLAMVSVRWTDAWG